MSQVLLMKRRPFVLVSQFIFVVLFSVPGSTATRKGSAATKACEALTWDQALEKAERATDDDRACLAKFLSGADPKKWETKLVNVLLEEWVALNSPELSIPRLLDEAHFPKPGPNSLNGGWVYFHVTVDEKGFPVGGCIDGEFVTKDINVLNALLSSRYRPARVGLKFVRGTFIFVIMRCR